MKFEKRAIKMLNDTMFMADFSFGMTAKVVYNRDNHDNNWFELSIESNDVKIRKLVRYSYSEQWTDSESDREDLKGIIRDIFDRWIRKALERV